MSTEIEKFETKAQQVKWLETDYPTVYSNLMGVGLSPFDVSILFGEVGAASESDVTGRPRVKVLLSPEQAVNLVHMLVIALEKFVESNGPLRKAGNIDLSEFGARMDDARIKYESH